VSSPLKSSHGYLRRLRKANSKNLHSEDDRLVQAVGRRHSSLDGEATNVLPALLQKRHQVVDGQHNVGNKLLLGHLDVADGDTHAEHLLELELDGGLDLVDLAGKVVSVRDGGGELASWIRVSMFFFKMQYNVEGCAYPWKDRDPRDEGSA
jgi:hypothetical protein